jgi:DNA-binding XRE family transcriptional regulator
LEFKGNSYTERFQRPDNLAAHRDTFAAQKPFRDARAINLGRAVAGKLRESGLSKTEVGKRAGIDRKTVQMIASGRSNSKRATVKQLAAVFNCQLTELAPWFDDRKEAVS